jgi:hypothetical protein
MDTNPANCSVIGYLKFGFGIYRKATSFAYLEQLGQLG